MAPSITSLESILISIQLVCMTAFVPGVHQRIPLLLISDLCLLLTSVLLLLSLSPIAISLPFNAASALAPSLLPDATHAALGSNSSIAAPAGPGMNRGAHEPGSSDRAPVVVDALPFDLRESMGYVKDLFWN